jgi:hypothetical protein
MTQSNTPTSAERIQELRKSAEYLTEWEVNFLSSVESQIKRGFTLSPKQLAIIDKLEKQIIERLD